MEFAAAATRAMPIRVTYLCRPRTGSVRTQLSCQGRRGWKAAASFLDTGCGILKHCSIACTTTISLRQKSTCSGSSPCFVPHHLAARQASPSLLSPTLPETKPFQVLLARATDGDELSTVCLPPRWGPPQPLVSLSVLPFAKNRSDPASVPPFLVAKVFSECFSCPWRVG